MKMSNFAFERADWAAEKERADGIEKARIHLNSEGTKGCIDCGEEINQARRKALPSATRCIACQQRIEKG